MLKATKKIYTVLTKKQRRFTVVLFFMMLLGGIMESLSVSLILPLIEAMMDEKNWDSAWYTKLILSIFSIEGQRNYLIFMLLALIVIFVVKNLYLLVEYYVQYTFVAKCRYNMQSKLIERYLAKPYDFYLYADSGEILRIIKTDTAQTFILLTNILNFFMELIVGVVLALTVFIISPVIAIVMVCVLLLEILLIGKVVKPKMNYYGETMRKEGAVATKWVLQSINGIKSIKVEQDEDFFARQYQKHVHAEIDMNRKQQITDNIPKLITESVTLAACLLLMLVYILNGAEISLLVSQMSAFAVAALRLIPCANRMSVALNQVPFYAGGLDNVIENLKVEGRYLDEEAEKEEKAKSLGEPIPCRETISFRDVTFHYKNNDKVILNHSDIEISMGQSIGIKGPSGAGKTTAVDVILGLLKPVSGQVLVDGRNIEENLSSWLDNVAYIPQQIFLIDDSVRNNVALGENPEDIDDARVLAALKEAQLEEFVAGLPHGLDEEIGEGGVRISGGQRQRLGIARALYHDPKVMIFDEATSALDNETEAAIIEVINSLKGSRTLIIIAHRLTTIENCDVVYCVDGGNITRER